MPKDSGLTKEDFDALLNWFSPNRDEAGAKYEEIRNGLIRYFNFKGCTEAENLADETINRVARKFSTFNLENDHKHITYFYGFAANIYKESRKKIEQVELDPNLRAEPDDIQEINSKEITHQCLDGCLGKLSSEDSRLAVQYFCKEKSAKFEHRRNLAEDFKLKMGALHVKVHRLKATLRHCVENCMKEK